MLTKRPLLAECRASNYSDGGMTDNDPERSFLKMEQASEFWLYSLIKINNSKNHRLGRSWQAAFAGKNCQYVDSLIERAV